MQSFGQRVSKLYSGVLIFLGFWLSPLSPWNDLFTNIPIAYVFGFVFSILSESLFLPAVIFGYWLSDMVGFLLMHYGYVRIQGGGEYSFVKHWKSYLFWTSLYTIIIAVLIWLEVLPNAQDVIRIFLNNN